MMTGGLESVRTSNTCTMRESEKSASERASPRNAARRLPSPPAAARDTTFADVDDLPAADLVFAGYSLPFATEAEFTHVWSQLTAALVPGGVFAGQLFGDRDDWAHLDDVRTHTAEQVRDLLAGWHVLLLDEVERDGPSGRGPKHWHVFDIIARRR